MDHQGECCDVNNFSSQFIITFDHGLIYRLNLKSSILLFKDVPVWCRNSFLLMFMLVRMRLEFFCFLPTRCYTIVVASKNEMDFKCRGAAYFSSLYLSFFDNDYHK